MRSRAEIELDHAGIVVRLLRLDQDILRRVPMSFKRLPDRPSSESGVQPLRKNILVFFSRKSLLHPWLSRPARGAYRDRHGRWVRDAVDAACHRRMTLRADGEAVWS